MYENHAAIERAGGLVGVQWKQATPIGQDLDCETNALGGIATDELGRTNINGVYATGDTVTNLMQAQLILAAANGSKVAAGVNTDLIASYFEQ